MELWIGDLLKANTDGTLDEASLLKSVVIKDICVIEFASPCTYCVRIC